MIDDVKKMTKSICLWLILMGLVHGAVLAAKQRFPQPDIPLPTFKVDTFDIRKYGAIAEPGVLNTNAIQRAIDECSRSGGGVVIIPPGVWLSGPLKLKSYVNFHLQRNAILQFSRNFDDYPLVETTWEGLRQMRMHSPIRAEGAYNIAITGNGVIDGNGDAFRPVKRSKQTEAQWNKLVASGGVVSADGKEWYPSAAAMTARSIPDAGALAPGKDVEFFETIKDFLRPNLVVLERCERILLEGVTFQNSGAWNLHPLMSRDITIRNIIVRNPWYSQNGDGIDIESCHNVLVENCLFDVGDDAICIKSGKDEYGRKLAMPTEDVWVTGCTVYHGHGGFVVGSEMSGGARNLYVTDCTFIGTDTGLRFKTRRGRGGLVENVYISNIYMKDIAGEAIIFDMYYQAMDPLDAIKLGEVGTSASVEPVSERTPQFRRFTLDHITCDGASKALFIRGLPEMGFHSITINDYTARAETGIDIQEASTVSLRNIRVDVPQGVPVVQLFNAETVTIDHLTFPKETSVLVQIGGEKSKDIEVINTDMNNAKKPFVVENGAKAQAISIKKL